MRPPSVPVWKQIPFLRLLIPFCSGILLQFYTNTGIIISAALLVTGVTVYLLIYCMPINIRFTLSGLQGFMLSLIIAGAAMLLTWKADIRHHPHWFVYRSKPGDSLLIRIDEDLQSKPKSFKTSASVLGVIHCNDTFPATGKLVLYLSKDLDPEGLSYGDLICFSHPLSPIRNSGNPGAFEYARYAAMQGVFHSVYLKQGQWRKTGLQQTSIIQRSINRLRKGVLGVMQKSFGNDKPVLGIAEALLIGYKDHLDRDLVREYTQAGVVHIIAISGLHLGLIYWMITALLARIPLTRKRPVIQYILSFTALWLFTLVTGASASVLRSAVMFSCMLLGKALSKRSTILQALTASAFLLLAWNPYLLWDVGFQLSYLALTGIILLQKPIGRLLFVKKKWLQKSWEMMAVTLAAQIGTFPICLFYFHQFPTYFFLANLIAVPLSTLILFLEIGLLAFSWIDPLNRSITFICSKSIAGMNGLIHAVNDLPGSLISGIYADIPGTICLHILIAGTAGWLILKSKRWFFLGCMGLSGFVICHALSDVISHRRQAIVLYNISGKTAIDFVSGQQCRFWGDASLRADEDLKNTHLMPTRTWLQIQETKESLAGLEQAGQLFRFRGRTIYILDKKCRFRPGCKKINIDILLIAGNPNIRMRDLSPGLSPSIIIFAPSNSLWKIAQWKKECEVLHLPCFSIPERGARVIPSGEPLSTSFPDR